MSAFFVSADQRYMLADLLNKTVSKGAKLDLFPTGIPAKIRGNLAAPDRTEFYPYRQRLWPDNRCCAKPAGAPLVDDCVIDIPQNTWIEHPWGHWRQLVRTNAQAS